MNKFSKLKFFVKKFPLSVYGILFLITYISWILVQVDTNRDPSILWKVLWFIFLPLIGFLIKLNEVLASSKTGLFHGIFVVSLIISSLFLIDLLLLYFRKYIIPAIRYKNMQLFTPMKHRKYLK